MYAPFLLPLPPYTFQNQKNHACMHVCMCMLRIFYPFLPIMLGLSAAGIPRVWPLFHDSQAGSAVRDKLTKWAPGFWRCPECPLWKWQQLQWSKLYPPFNTPGEYMVNTADRFAVNSLGNFVETRWHTRRACRQCFECVDSRIWVFDKMVQSCFTCLLSDTVHHKRQQMSPVCENKDGVISYRKLWTQMKESKN